jgi:hypothetical protein
VERDNDFYRIYERELSITAGVLSRKFIQRWDIYPKQLNDGRYITVREPLTQNKIKDHLEGKVTLGTYVLDSESTARFCVLDADDDSNYYHLFEMARDLKYLDIPSYIETSRRGGHIWFFFDQPVSGEAARLFGLGLLDKYLIKEVEVYPKQERLKTGPGSLIRLPFGVHKKSGRRYGFVNHDGLDLAPSLFEQIFVLSSAETVPYQLIEKYKLAKPEKHVRISEGDNAWDRIKESVSAVEFIGRYMDLKETASGGVGYCPFHEDNVPSFGVNSEGNFWNCFAGCGGGSIIDFWMMYNNVDFKTAVEELSKMLGVDDG